MTNNHFVISQRESGWQFSYRGDVTAPFATKQQAVAAAIDAAGKLEDADVEVVVHDADFRAETVWRSGQSGSTAQ
ncbi:MAG TPA: DUF2188 domain-containing protein [Devosia sp.]|jgi:hypothetical protein|nr:DUF2188 domain-containing protein [Devosia sp.]